MPLTASAKSFGSRYLTLRGRPGLWRNNSTSTCAREFKVVLNNNTLYIEQPLAEALGWKRDMSTQGVSLTLSGWAPHYFAIAPAGTDADLLARGTVESSRNPNVHRVLNHLKDYDAQS